MKPDVEEAIEALTEKLADLDEQMAEHGLPPAARVISVVVPAADLRILLDAYAARDKAVKEAVRLMRPVHDLRHWLDWQIAQIPRAGDASVIDAGASSVDPESAPLILTLGDLRALSTYVTNHEESDGK